MVTSLLLKMTYKTRLCFAENPFSYNSNKYLIAGFNEHLQLSFVFDNY